MIAELVKQGNINYLAQIVPEFTEKEIAAATKANDNEGNLPYVYIAIAVVLVTTLLLIAIMKMRKSK